VSAATATAARLSGRAWGTTLLSVLPLVTVFSWACLLYAWQAWALEAPWLFTDELKYTQLSRSIAEGSGPAIRGESQGLDSLYVLAIAPAWLIDDAQLAYTFAKVIGVVAMSAAAFPAYALARLLVGPRPALFAAAGTVAIPAFMYSALLIQEPLAYLVSTLALFLGVKALLTRRPRWIAGAVVAAVLAPLVRGQLAVVPVVLVLSAFVVAWRGDTARRWRKHWSLADKAGTLALVVGVAVVLNEFVGHQSGSWQESTRHLQDRMLEYGLWAGGALTIGLGVLPVVVGLAVLARPRGEGRRPAETTFVIVFAVSLVAFGFYTAIKAAYLSAHFSLIVAERNLIYLAPLFFVATALWLERRRLRPAALVLAAAFVALLLERTPFKLDYPYFEAPGFSILALGNRWWEWPIPTLEWVMRGVLAGVVLLVAAASAQRGPRLARSGLVAAGVLLVLAWNVTGQLGASDGSRAIGRLFIANFPKPPDWVDRATGGAPTVYLGRQVKDPTGVHQHEFWNRSITQVWTLEGTAPGPGPSRSPNLATPRGVLSPSPGTRYAVAEPGVTLSGRVVAARGQMKVVELDGRLRLRESRTGIYSDGWMAQGSAFNQFTGRRAGIVDVRLSRGGVDITGNVRVTVGPVVIKKLDQQAHIGRETQVRTCSIRGHVPCLLHIPTPPPPFRVEVAVDPVFVPQQLDPANGDARELGAQIEFAFKPGSVD